MTSKDSPTTSLLLVSILLLGVLFGFVGIDWDEGRHLHPDERFLTMVTTAIHPPKEAGLYFDESRSTLNPRNVGYSFYPYGVLPTMLVKGLGSLLGMTEYHRIHLVGRGVSASAFVGSIFLVFLLARRLTDQDRVALLAAFLFACSVLPIQQAHFYTVDSLCAFFILAAMYFLVRAQQTESLGDYLLTGALFALATACKASIFTFAFLVAVVGATALIGVFRRNVDRHARIRGALRVGGMLAASGVCAFLVFRVAAPDAFQGPGFFGMKPSERWLANLLEARWLVSGEVDFPPGHQWTDRTPILFPLQNMVVWGMGPLLGLAAWIGWLTAVWVMVRRRSLHLLVPVLWVGLLFFHQGTQWVKSMRYFLPIYPLLALFAAWWLVRSWERCAWWLENRPWDVAYRRIALRTAAVGIVLVPLGTFVWGWAFLKVYLNPHPRIAASRWIFENVPPGSTLAGEHWDDALPLPLRDHPTPPTVFETVQFEWYGEDTPDKLAKSLDLLDRTDYIVLSSNRLYDSIPRLPMRYPMTVKYYDALFGGDLGFVKVAEFTSYPGILGVEFPDQSAEEAFSVYDHPKVQVFRKTEAYDRNEAEAILGEVEWDRIVRLTPKQVPEWRPEVKEPRYDLASEMRPTADPGRDSGIVIPAARSVVQRVRSWVKRDEEPVASQAPAYEAGSFPQALDRTPAVGGPNRLASRDLPLSAQPRTRILPPAASHPTGGESNLGPAFPSEISSPEAVGDKGESVGTFKSKKGPPPTGAPPPTFPPPPTTTPFPPTSIPTPTTTSFHPTPTSHPFTPTMTWTAQPTFTATFTSTLTPIPATQTTTPTSTENPTLTATPSETPVPSPTSTETPTETASLTLTESATWTPDFDVAPETPDGLIDARDLLEWVRRIENEEQPATFLFDFSRTWHRSQ